MPRRRRPKPAEKHEPETVPFSAKSENWLRDFRLKKLRARGWKGSLKRWVEAYREHGADPLTLNPPITR